MNVCVVQPAYSFDYSRSDELFQWEMAQMDACGPDCDLIVLPEYSNVPALAHTREETMASMEKYGEPLLKKAAETAKRCESTLFLSCLYETPDGVRNAIVAFDRQGNQAGTYFKQHLVPSEMAKGLDKQYTYEFSEPTILEVDGVRYGFLICYDFYFYENFANIARYDPDVIIACSHQRSDTHQALRIMSQFCAYNTNSYVVRASVSLGADSPVGATSMVVAPDGTILLDMENKVGRGMARFDPHQRYLKPAGFGNPPATHHSYIEDGRRPWKYRAAGSAIALNDKQMPYPRVCAHRGFNTVAPENSMPAYGAAVAMGAEEIEFDLWSSSDGAIVSIHDPMLDRVSNGHGYIWEHSFAQLRELDFGSVYSPEYAGLRIPSFEEILEKFACHTVMNVHIKTRDDIHPLPEETVRSIIASIKKYDCEKYVYFMTGNPALLAQLREMAPHIARCAGATGDPHEDLVAKALRYDCAKIQLFKPHFAKNGPDYVEKTIRCAHENGIRVNVFYSDTPEETERYLRMGADVILTNDYQRNAQAARGFQKKR